MLPSWHMPWGPQSGQGEHISPKYPLAHPHCVPMHRYPASTTHVLEQPSPPKSFPSSQASPASMTPLPQAASIPLPLSSQPPKSVPNKRKVLDIRAHAIPRFMCDSPGFANGILPPGTHSLKEVTPPSAIRTEGGAFFNLYGASGGSAGHASASAGVPRVGVPMTEIGSSALTLLPKPSLSKWKSITVSSSLRYASPASW